MKYAMMLLCFNQILLAQVMFRAKGEDWMLVTSDPPNCSLVNLTTSSAVTSGSYTLPCHMNYQTSIRWFSTEDAAIAWANDTQSPSPALYHVDRETSLQTSEYDVPVKQPDKIEHRKKYTRAK